MPEIVVGTNSYVSLEDADLYFGSRIFSEAWADLSDDDKILFLISAVKYLDHGFVWVGDKTLPDQPLEWPRLGEELVPTVFAEAQCEIALLLIQEGGDLRETVKSLKLDKVDVTFGDTGIFPVLVINMLSGLGAVKSQTNSMVSVGVIRS